jgi:hypothetical protein
MFSGAENGEPINIGAGKTTMLPDAQTVFHGEFKNKMDKLIEKAVKDFGSFTYSLVNSKIASDNQDYSNLSYSLKTPNIILINVEKLDDKNAKLTIESGLIDEPKVINVTYSTVNNYKKISSVIQDHNLFIKFQSSSFRNSIAVCAFETYSINVCSSFSLHSFGCDFLLLCNSSNNFMKKYYKLF